MTSDESTMQARQIIRATAVTPPVEVSESRQRGSVSGRYDGGETVFVQSTDASAVQAAAILGDRMPGRNVALVDMDGEDD